MVGLRGGVIDVGCKMDRGSSCWRILFLPAADAVRNHSGLDIWPGWKGVGIGGL